MTHPQQQPFSPPPRQPKRKRFASFVFPLLVIVAAALAVMIFATGLLTVKVNHADAHSENRVVNKALSISYAIPDGYERGSEQKNVEGSEFINSIITSSDFNHEYRGRPLLTITKITPSYGGDAVAQAQDLKDAVRALPQTHAYDNDCQLENERWTTWDGPNLPGALYSATCRFKSGKPNSEGATHTTYAVAVVGQPGDRWQVDGSSIDYRPADEFGLYFLARSVKRIDQ